MNDILIAIKQNDINKILYFLNQNNDTFSFKILENAFKNNIVPKEYFKVAKLDFSEDFSEELENLFSVLKTLQESNNFTDTENLIALTLLECTIDVVKYIEENSNDYPKGEINAKIWTDGIKLRSLADELAIYFENNFDEFQTTNALLLKTKLTCSILNHYPNLVGPDMVKLATQYEKTGNYEQAKNFYNAVVLDFVHLVEQIQNNLKLNNESEEDFEITESLVKALLGLKRIGEKIDENHLSMAKSVLKTIN